MRRIRWAAALGVLTALVGVVAAAAPWTASLEETLGLRWLFWVRGQRVPPAPVVIVSLDEAAATRLEIPVQPRDWPRSLHATLVDRLTGHRAAAIAFDMQFLRHSVAASDDDSFAQAVARSGRVALVQRFEIVDVDGIEGGAWEVRNPIPPLAAAAAALAPAPMPDGPLVTWSWSFLPTRHMGDVPALSAVALQLQALPVTDSFVDELERSGVDGLSSLRRPVRAIRHPADVLQLMQTLRRVSLQHRRSIVRLIERLERAQATSASAERATHLALAALYSGDGYGYLNFYGPPGTICTVPYDVALDVSRAADAPCSFRDAIVLVGLASGPIARAGYVDTHHTVYGGGDAFSGVELHATMLANLLDRTTLRQQSGAALLLTLLLVGVALGGLPFWVRTRARRVRTAAAARVEAAAVLVALGTAYGMVAHLTFSELHLVLPIIVPLAFQLPAALSMGLLVPPVRRQEHVQAACLITDATGSTARGQQMSHRHYAHLMDAYNQALSAPARAFGGDVLPPQGDGFVSVWCVSAGHQSREVAEADARLQACLAAIEISRAAAQFNRDRADSERLPTRIGLAIGPITVFSDTDRGVYEVLGDPINVAARLRDLPVPEGPAIVASQAVVVGLERTIAARPLPGIPALKGVTHPPDIFQIQGLADAAGTASGSRHAVASGDV